MNKSNNENLAVIRNEFQILQKIAEDPIKHRNIIHLHHVSNFIILIVNQKVWEFKNYYIIAMDIAKGGSLEDYIRRRKDEKDPI